MDNMFHKALLKATAAIVLLWVFPYLLYKLSPVAGIGFSTEDLVNFYGALNTLFSGLAFAGVVVALRLQMLELSENRREFARSALAQEAAAKISAHTFLANDATTSFAGWKSIKEKELTSDAYDVDAMMRGWAKRQELLVFELERVIGEISSDNGDKWSEIVNQHRSLMRYI